MAPTLMRSDGSRKFVVEAMRGEGARGCAYVMLRCGSWDRRVWVEVNTWPAGHGTARGDWASARSTVRGR